MPEPTTVATKSSVPTNSPVSLVVVVGKVCQKFNGFEIVENCREHDMTRQSLYLVSLLSVLAVLLLTACAPPGESTWFRDEAELRGVGFVHVSGFKDRPYLPEIMGGGIALFDLEDDGDLDLFFVQSGWHLGSAESASARASHELYLNDGAGNFTRGNLDIQSSNTAYGMGVTAGDYDNDGDTDLYLTNLGENVLLRNDGAGRFRDETVNAGVADAKWSTAATFSDFDNDGDLDLFVANNLNWLAEREIDCFARGVLTYCLPTNYQAPQVDSLFRNNGDGTFTDVTSEAGFRSAFGNGLGAVPADFNSDGLLDLFVANDTMVNQLWLNQGNLVFKNEAVQWGSAVDNHGFAKAGMGIDAADLDDDSDHDVIVVNLEGQSDSVFLNQNTYFRDQTSRVGLGADSRQYTRFGVALVDFDNDSVLDLIEANGKVDGDPRNPEDVFAEPNLVMRGQIVDNLIRFMPLATSDGTIDVQKHTSRALAVGDLDTDGDLDVVVVNRDSMPYVLMNQVGQDNHWLRFRVLNQYGSDALGATVKLTIGSKRQIRYVKVAGSYLSSHDPHVHFGLGSAQRVTEVVVTWPTGEMRELGDVEANQIVSIKP